MSTNAMFSSWWATAPRLPVRTQRWIVTRYIASASSSSPGAPEDVGDLAPARVRETLVAELARTGRSPPGDRLRASSKRPLRASMLPWPIAVRAMTCGLPLRWAASDPTARSSSTSPDRRAEADRDTGRRERDREPVADLRAQADHLLEPAADVAAGAR